jgi:hypothetical protein
MGLERGPLSLVSTTEELLKRKSRGSCLENREYGRRDPPHWPCGTLYPQKLELTSPTSGDRLVGIVRSRTEIMEFIFVLFFSFPQKFSGILADHHWAPSNIMGSSKQSYPSFLFDSTDGSSKQLKMLD